MRRGPAGPRKSQEIWIQRLESSGTQIALRRRSDNQLCDRRNRAEGIGIRVRTDAHTAAVGRRRRGEGQDQGDLGPRTIRSGSKTTPNSRCWTAISLIWCLANTSRRPSRWSTARESSRISTTGRSARTAGKRRTWPRHESPINRSDLLLLTTVFARYIRVADRAKRPDGSMSD